MAVSPYFPAKSVCKTGRAPDQIHSAVRHQQDQIRFIECRDSSFDAFPLNNILAVTHAGGVDDMDGQTIEVDFLTNDIPSSTGDVVTMAVSVPASAFNRLDLPALGAPTRTTVISVFDYQSLMGRLKHIVRR